MRNSLANRIGKGRLRGNDLNNVQFRQPTKKRLKISKIPLDVSDFVIEDMWKEFGEPAYFNIYDTKDDRTAMCEFSDLGIMESIANKFSSMDFNGAKVETEIFELKGRQGRNSNTRGSRGKRGSHYESNRTSKANTQPKLKSKQPTAEDLDAELEEYMNN